MKSHIAVAQSSSITRPNFSSAKASVYDEGFMHYSILMFVNAGILKMTNSLLVSQFTALATGEGAFKPIRGLIIFLNTCFGAEETVTFLHYATIIFFVSGCFLIIWEIICGSPSQA